MRLRRRHDEPVKEIMTTETALVSRYELRVKLVRDVLKENTKLSDSESRALAVRLLHTMDSIPERVR